MIKAAIIGGSGYVAGEILRLLLFHPEVEVIGISSQSYVGQKVSNIHLNLTNVSQLKFEKENLSKFSSQADVIFFALPHGLSMKKAKKVDLNQAKVIDLSADFRIKNSQTFKQTYKVEHQSKNLLTQAVYGLPEFNALKIKKAKLVACPGCFPTGALLAVLPLIKTGWVNKKIIINAVTGSSGSGVSPSDTTHHPQRALNFKAYQVFAHRHQPEIEQEINNAGHKKFDLIFTPHSSPMIRGIFTTAYVSLNKKIGIKKIKKIYQKAYQKAPFIRMVNNPQSAVVKNSNYCDLAIFNQDKEVIITTAIDNLLKGAAGQAVQNMNLMFGLPETLGLEFPGTQP